MKRTISILLCFVMFLTLLPVTAHAGGGGGGLYWDGCVDAENAMDLWYAVDANRDGVTFGVNQEPNGTETVYSVRSAASQAQDSVWSTTDDYLVSPIISLGSGQEYTLYFKAAGVWPQNTWPFYEVYVYEFDEPLTADNLAPLYGESVKIYSGSVASNLGDTYTYLDLTSFAGRDIQLVFHISLDGQTELWLERVAISWQEPDEMLGKVTATNVPLPNAGDTLADLDESQITFPDFANYSLVPGSLSYDHIVSEQGFTMHEGEQFLAGDEYIVHFDVVRNENVDLSDSPICSVNGKWGFTQVREDQTIRVHYDHRIPAPAAVEKITVTFHSNGLGKAPDLIQIPIGTSVDSFFAETPEALWMDDTNGMTHFGWSLSSHPTSEDLFDTSKHLYRSVDLYAVWQDLVKEVALSVDVPAAGHATTELIVQVDKAAGYEVNCCIWWTDPELNNDFEGSLEAGRTYYVGVNLLSDKYRCFDMDVTATVRGAEKTGVDFFSPSAIRVYFKFTVPASGTKLTELSLYISPTWPIGVSVEKVCLTNGACCWDNDVWWENEADVGDDRNAYGGMRKPGKTYYTRTYLQADDGFTLDPNTVTVHAEGARVLKTGPYPRNENCVAVDLAVDVPMTHTFTLWVEGSGGILFSGESGLHGFFDFAYVREASYTVTAFPDPGWKFVGWYDGETLLSTDTAYTFTLDHDVDHWTAVFEQFEPEFIPRVELSLVIPVVGDVFHATQEHAQVSVANDAPVVISFSGWYNEWGLSDPNLTFKDGAKYFAEIQLKAKEGFVLTENTQVTVNGEPVDQWRKINVETFSAATRLYEMPTKPQSELPDFEDTKDAGRYYYDAVRWAVSHEPQITNGTDSTHFSPDATCTRGQVVTFLWRAAGCPEPNGSSSPFTDVKESAYYFKAILWAVENGITNGSSKTTFSPSQACTRGQVVTFLHRFAKTPAPESTELPFSDVKPDAFFFNAVLWALEKNITAGTGRTSFSPDAPCTRGQIVTFLWRSMK